MATATQNGEDLFRQAIGAWESAVESGVKMQEQSAKWVREMFCNSNSLTEWYNKGQTVAGETIVKAQENIDEAIRVVNQQAESSVRLMQKALDARQSDATSGRQGTVCRMVGSGDGIHADQLAGHAEGEQPHSDHLVGTGAEDQRRRRRRHVALGAENGGTSRQDGAIGHRARQGNGETSVGRLTPIVGRASSDCIVVVRSSVLDRAGAFTGTRTET